MIEIRKARAATPDKPEFDNLFLELLRQSSLDLAAIEAERFVQMDRPADMVLAVAIGILAERAEKFPKEQFQTEAARLIALSERFEKVSSDRDRDRTSDFLSLVYFNLGMIRLKLGNIDEAHRALERASQIKPFDEMFIEATQLDAYDDRAREIAVRVRSRSLVAA